MGKSPILVAWNPHRWAVMIPPKKPSTNWLPGGAPYSLAISSCVAGNSLEDVLNAPGTVYYVDAQGRLYLKRLGRPKR